MLNVTVRSPHYRELPLLAAMHNAVLKEHAERMPDMFKLPPSVEVVVDEMRASIHAGGCILLVGLVQRRIVGYISGRIVDKPETIRRYRRRILYLDSVYVEPAHRRSGVGTTLYTNITEEALPLLINEIAFDVWVNNEESIRFCDHLMAESEVYTQHVYTIVP